MKSIRSNRYRQRHELLLLTSILFAFLTAGCSFFGGGNAKTQTTPTPTSGSSLPAGGSGYFPSGAFHVQGNRLVDSSGHAFMLRGAQIEGAFNVQQQGASERLATQNLDSTTFNVMHQQWNMNALRIPLCDYLWQASPTGYLQRLDGVVQQAVAAKLVVVLDLHENGHCGVPASINTRLPLPLSKPFWQAIASHYRANPDVIFDVYNEPTVVRHQGKNRNQSAADWQLWLYGGTLDGQTFLGMQDLVGAIRSTGAQQVIAVEGLSIGTSFNNIGSALIDDPDILYEVHMYFSNKNSDSSVWDEDFGFLSGRVPIYVGEWAFLPYKGSAGHCPIPQSQAAQKIDEFLNYMADHEVGWTAWAFMPNRLILGYSNYAPTALNGGNFTCGPGSSAGMGELLKQYLTGQS